MSRPVLPLTDTQIRNAKPRERPYKLADGGSLYLEIMPNGSKIWRMKFMQASGKESRLSFGSYPEFTLAQARQARAAARAQKTAGNAPGMAKRELKRANALATSQTFESIALTWLRKSAATRAATIQKKTPTG